MIHAYLMLNAAIAIGYIISRLLRVQQLKFARYSFCVAIIVFSLMPSLLNLIPSSYHSNFQFEPVLKNASADLLQNNKIINEQIIQIASTQAYFSMDMILIFMLLVGIGFFSIKYINNLRVLKKIQKNAFCRHRLNNIYILFSNTAEIPFCWSFLKKHFIVIPKTFLEKSDDLKLAIYHEMQHIRQGDTQWLHFLMLIKIVCFWNPFIKFWMNWLDELQEFACDESILRHKKASPVAYAQCLINAASDVLKNGSLGMRGLSKSILYRRVNMLFMGNKSKTKKVSVVFAYIISFFMAISAAYAFNGTSSESPLSTQQVENIIKKSDIDKSFQISATPEVVAELNNIRSSDKARKSIHDSLQRMKKYQLFIQESLKQEAMPNDLLAVPLVESGYQPLDQSKNQLLAAGIWQIVPGTGKRLGLIVNGNRDDRLDTQLSTKAALTYLQMNHRQFDNWKLAVIAYEIGEDSTDKLIKTTGSRDPWVLASSSAAPESLKKFIAMFDAAVIIMHNPELID